MYVCMHAGMYVCMSVCKYKLKHKCKWKYKTEVYTYICIHVCVYIQYTHTSCDIHVCTHIWYKVNMNASCEHICRLKIFQPFAALQICGCQTIIWENFLLSTLNSAGTKGSAHCRFTNPKLVCRPMAPSAAWAKSFTRSLFNIEAGIRDIVMLGPL